MIGLLGKTAGVRPNLVPVHACGKQVAELKIGPKGRATVEIFPGALKPEQQEALVSHLAAFFQATGLGV